MSAPGDRLIRLLGADPAVYRPVARAHTTIINRRARLARQRSGWIARHLPPFYFLCLMAFVSGVAVSSIALAVAPLLLGGATVLTFGAIFLTLIIILDDFDVLVNPSEYLVLAAHPHDGWSVLLAKIVVVGRSIAVLGAFYFSPASIIVAVTSHNAVAAIAFLFGAGCLTISVGSGGMLFAAALLSLWGRKALDRLLPMVQALYMVSILFSTMGRQAMRHVALPTLSQTGIVQWVVPTTWFIWPLEFAVGTHTGASWVRAALASGSLVALTAVGANWIGGRFGERLLDPPSIRGSSRKARTRREPRAGSGWAPTRLVGRSPESRAVLKLTSAHIRSDIMFRSSLMATAITPLILLSSVYVSRSTKGIGGRPEFALGMLGFGLTVMLGSVVRILTMSSRPEALWCVLASPAGRSKFSLATISAVRAFVVIPYLCFMAIVAVAMRAGQPWSILLALASMGVLTETVLKFWRGFYPDMPFSLPVRRAGKMSGAQIFTMIGGMLVSVGAVSALAVAQYFGLWPQAAILVIFSSGLVLASLWARWRVTREAEAFEIRADEVRV